MRILLCGVAAVALSGCSWLGYTTDGYEGGSSYSASHHGNTGGGHYNPQISSGQYAGTAYQSGGYAYPVAQTYPMDFDPSGPIVGNTIYPAATHQAHSGHHNGAHGYHGPKAENRWTVNGSLGTEFTTDGDIFNGSRAAGPGFNNVNMKDAYEMGLRAELGAARSLRGNRMVTGQMFYSKADGERVNLRGTGANTRSGKFSDHESYGVELGLRQYVSMRNSAYKPYVEGRLGAAHVDDIQLEDYRLNTGVAGTGLTTDFIEGGWVPTGAALIGVERPISDKMMLGLETGLRYSGELDGDTLSAAAPGFVGSNDYQERWTVPVSLRGRYRF